MPLASAPSPPPAAAKVTLDRHLAELAVLDVVDVLADGTMRLNPDFVADCLARYDADPSCLGTVFQERIVERAVERGYAGCVDADELTLAALVLGAEEEEERNASA